MRGRWSEEVFGPFEVVVRQSGLIRRSDEQMIACERQSLAPDSRDA